MAKSLTFISRKVKLCFVHTILTKHLQIVHAYLFRSLKKKAFFNVSQFPSDKLPFIISKGKYSSTPVILKSLRFLQVKQDIHFKLVWTTGPRKREGKKPQEVNSQKEDICITKSNDLLWLQTNVRGYAHPFLRKDKKISFKRKGKLF